jgi:hypothetical protein
MLPKSHPSLPGRNDPEQKDKKFEFVARLLVPLAALLAATLQQQRANLFLAVAVFSLAVGLIDPVGSRVTALRNRRHDLALARKALPALRRFIARFGEFVDSNRNDSLHSIVRDTIAQTDFRIAELLCPVPIYVFDAHFQLLHANAPDKLRDIRTFESYLKGFDALIHTYEQHVVRGVFDKISNAPSGVSLTTAGKRALHTFRERYVDFRASYEEFEKDLISGLQSVSLHSMYFERPKPLYFDAPS